MTDGTRRRIHHWSPWGSDESGIANYSSLLVPALNQHVDVTIVHPSETDTQFRSRRPDDVNAPTLDDADVHMFHIGNHLSFHHWMVAPLLRHGGIVVLHDWSVYDIFRPMFYRSWHLWEKELLFNQEKDLDLARSRGEPGFLMQHPLNRRVVTAADIVVVHTPWMRDLATQHYPDADVRYVPHAGHLWPSSPITEHSPITVLGGVGRHKRVSSALEAFARATVSHPTARLRIVGRGEDRGEVRRLRDLALELNIDDRVEWHLNVDRATYLRLLGESLMVVTLRSDTAGEMSGVMIEAWGAGRVAVTSDQPQFRSYDQRFCRRVSLGEHGTDELSAVMSDALANPASFAADGALGQELLRNEFSFATVAAQYAELVEELAARKRTDPLSGLNVYGSWGTPSGLGQAARSHTEALLEANVPITLPYGLSLPHGDPRLVPRAFASQTRRASYAINLLMANINEFHEIPKNVFGTPHAPRWNIASWIYEFPAVPAVLVPRFSLVNEIWAGSHFAADVFGAYFDGPVTTVPYIVSPRGPSESPSATRARYGITEDTLVVLFSFDFLSGWARKNPLAVIRAFRDAVRAEGAPKAQLIIKVSRASAAYREVLLGELAAVGGLLIDEHLSATAITDLFQACDVYMSLHRAEGFGLGMAEAMAMGKMTIGTGYSGNLDFMNTQNSLLVDCAMRPITLDDVAPNPGWRTIAPLGSQWAEPDHESAVAALQQAFSSSLCSSLGAQAAADLHEKLQRSRGHERHADTAS